MPHSRSLIICFIYSNVMPALFTLSPALYCWFCWDHWNPTFNSFPRLCHLLKNNSGTCDFSNCLRLSSVTDCKLNNVPQGCSRLHPCTCEYREGACGSVVKFQGLITSEPESFIARVLRRRRQRGQRCREGDIQDRSRVK